jgi:predicted enzyme related to lactoylglutathione lyase
MRLLHPAYRHEGEATMPKKALKKSARKSARASTTRKHVPTDGLYGWITHTDLGSRNPGATKAWCAKVLGWTFKPPFPTPRGDYHLFTYSAQGGGGIRTLNPDEAPGSIPYVHVADATASFAAAVREGAEVMMPPERVMEGVTIAVVRAPGGVVIGFSGP